MKYRSVLLLVHLASLMSLTVQRHLLAKNGPPSLSPSPSPSQSPLVTGGLTMMAEMTNVTEAEKEQLNQMTDIDYADIESLDGLSEVPPMVDEPIARRQLDDLSLTRKLGGLAGLSSLLTHSQRRISPLNKLILGLLGPKLIKLQLDMMFGAVISELVRKLVMPVVGFVIDKNLPVQASSKMQQPVPNYSTNQIEQLQSAYGATTALPPAATNPNYVNHPSYQSASSSSYTQGEGSIPYTYYGQAQLANYLASQPQSGRSGLPSSQDQPTTQAVQANPKLTTEQISQQLNQLISQYANAINQQAAAQRPADLAQQTPPPPPSLPATRNQNEQLYQQLHELMQEQVKLKSQLRNLTKPKMENYFAKEMQPDEEAAAKDGDEESSLRDAPLNQIEQEYDRATRLNSVLRNMDHYYQNNQNYQNYQNESSAIKRR